ncbi:TPA: hypothetical protein ACH3X2_002508 [Trebouxia sp. C0005]
MESEQEAAAAPASAPAPAHDSAARQHQVQTVVGRMRDMVAGNPEMQQHLDSHLNRAEGDPARTQASHQNGSAHPMATLSRVQDTWGNSIARKRVFGLDAGYLKSKHSKIAQQSEAGQAGPSAEPEAEPFSKPKAKGANLKPRQQIKAAAAAAADKENSSAKDIVMPEQVQADAEARRADNNVNASKQRIIIGSRAGILDEDGGCASVLTHLSRAGHVTIRLSPKYMESRGAGMPPSQPLQADPQVLRCTPLGNKPRGLLQVGMRFCKQVIPHEMSCYCEPCESQSVRDKWHVAGVENIPQTALRLTDDPEASWMWTLEIKPGIVLLSFCGSVTKMKTGPVIAVADAGPDKVQLQCHLAVNLSGSVCAQRYAI